MGIRSPQPINHQSAITPQSAISDVVNQQFAIRNPQFMRRQVLILSTTTGYQLRAFGDAAARLGIDLVFATDRCHMIDDPWRDSAIPVRFHEEDASLRAIVESAGQRRIDGVIAVGDRPVVLAARVTEALGLSGNPTDAAAASANKLLTRQHLVEAGLPAPWFVTVAETELPEGVRFPCVVKPLGLSGSRGVIRANTPGELNEALHRVRALLARGDVRVLRTGLEDHLLIEEFIEGREYAIEAVLTRGRLQTFAIFDKPDPLDGPFFEETIYLTPSALPAEIHRVVEEMVARAAQALGLFHGPLHAECRIGPSGIVVLEIAARPIGGLCSKVLRFERGETLEEVLLRHAAGDDVSSIAVDPRAAGVMMIPIPRRGRLRRVEGEDAARDVAGIEDVRITAKADQLLEPLPEAGSYLGFIFARGLTTDIVEEALREAHRRLRFVVDSPIEVT